MQGFNVPSNDEVTVNIHNICSQIKKLDVEQLNKLQHSDVVKKVDVFPITIVANQCKIC